LRGRVPQPGRAYHDQRIFSIAVFPQISRIKEQRRFGWLAALAPCQSESTDLQNHLAGDPAGGVVYMRRLINETLAVKRRRKDSVMKNRFKDLARFLIVLVTIGGARIANAQHYTFVDVPGGTNTYANGINNVGQIVGRFDDDSDGLTKAYFRDRNGQFRTLVFPSAVFTAAVQINNRGTIAGRYNFEDGLSHGFIFRGGRFETVDFPGATETWIRGLDEADNVMGHYFLNDDHEQGFIRDRTGFHTINFPDSLTSDVWDRNEFGVKVGDYLDSTPNGDIHGFTLRNGHLATLDFPGSPVNSLRGINDLGVIVAQFVGTDFFVHGFVKLPGSCFVQLDVPGFPDTFPNRINEADTIVGYYLDPSETFFHGFMLTDWQKLACSDPQSAGTRGARTSRWTKREQIERMRR
jgi:uncharacterized membrane protein